MIRALAVKTPGPLTQVGQLSGGNQQKVVIGRWLQKPPRILILDEPTRGVLLSRAANVEASYDKLEATIEGIAT